MRKIKKRKLSTPKQLEIVNEEMEKLKKRLKSKDVSAPNFVFGTQYFITQFAHNTAPSCNFATMVLLGAMHSYLENDVDKQQS
tara:strand:+ start:623 stop:871 length:249 start_codon:yes stop_codon:yes gene_type:complete